MKALRFISLRQCHYGVIGGGHYVSFVKNRTNQQWYCFNDSSCKVKISLQLLFVGRERFCSPSRKVCWSNVHRPLICYSTNVNRSIIVDTCRTWKGRNKWRMNRPCRTTDVGVRSCDFDNEQKHSTSAIIVIIFLFQISFSPVLLCCVIKREQISALQEN